MNDTLGWRERLKDLISYYYDDDNDDIWNRLRDEKKKDLTKLNLFIF